MSDDASAAGPDPILVVDDEPAIRTLFARTLQRAGFETIEAADGLAALEIIERQRVSLVLLDSAMPGLDGPGVLSRLRAREATTTLPVIMVTAHTGPDDLVRGLESGADDYLRKPVALPELIARAQAQLRSQAAWAGAFERDVRERRAIAEAVRRATLTDRPEVSAGALLAELTPVLGATGMALLAIQADGMVVSFGATGELERRYEVERALPAGESADLRARAADGPWVRLGRRLSPRWPDGPEMDISYVPLPGEPEPAGILVVAMEPDRSEDAGARAARRLPRQVEIAGTLSAILRPALQRDERLAGDRAALHDILAATAFTLHYQPIVRLADGAVVACEALTRFADGSLPGPRFAEAARLGLGLELELATLRMAVAGAADLPAGCSLSINASPALVTAGRGLDELVAGSVRPVIVELTEHEAVADYEALRSQLAALGTGVRVAVDDAGSGYASMRHIFALHPDIVKLDIDWVRDIDSDRARQALVAGLVHVAAELGADLVGEGIETEAERATLARLGVTFGQGFLLGRPAVATAAGRADPGWGAAQPG